MAMDNNIVAEPKDFSKQMTNNSFSQRIQAGIAEFCALIVGTFSHMFCKNYFARTTLFRSGLRML